MVATIQKAKECLETLRKLSLNLFPGPLEKTHETTPSGHSGGSRSAS